MTSIFNFFKVIHIKLESDNQSAKGAFCDSPYLFYERQITFVVEKVWKNFLSNLIPVLDYDTLAVRTPAYQIIEIFWLSSIFQ